jgi:hypothetical protein
LNRPQRSGWLPSANRATKELASIVASRSPFFRYTVYALKLMLLAVWSAIEREAFAAWWSRPARINGVAATLTGRDGFLGDDPFASVVVANLHARVADDLDAIVSVNLETMLANQRTDAMLTHLRLDVVRYSILEMVSANPGISQISLSGALGIERARLVALLDELQDLH